MDGERKEEIYDWQAHDRIVHNLRSLGWDRIDAIEEADKIMARVHAPRPLPHSKEGGK